MGYAVFADGTVRLFNLADGSLITQQRLFDASLKVTAWSFSPGIAEAAFGFSDGSACLARIGFSAGFLSLDEVPGDLHAKLGDRPIPMVSDGRTGMVQRLPDGQIRFLAFEVKAHPPIETGSTSPVAQLDHSVAASTTRMAVLHDDGSLFIEELRERTNVLTGETVISVRKGQVPYESPTGRTRPDYLKLAGLGDNILVIWKDGLLLRYDVRSLDNTRFAESVDLTPGESATLTRAMFLLGKATLVTGDSHGNVRAWFNIRPEHSSTPDGAVLTLGGTLHRGEGDGISSMAVADRGRMVALGFDSGRIELVHATSHKRVARIESGVDSVDLLTIAPKGDGMLAIAGGSVLRYQMDLGHPEVTLASMFTPVWYESAASPAHVWQSTGGTDDFEEKFGLYPLIFGTIKATVYSLLFGVPIALLAAIYTSEFMSRKVKATVKPMIEMMASLPSVVLGFLAALVIAPFVENVVPAVLSTFVCVPLMFLLGAHLWQLLPQKVSLRLAQWRFLAIVAMVPLGLGLSMLVGPMLERLLFGGDFKLWLNAGPDDPRFGAGFGGWTMMYLPVCGLLVAGLMARYVNPVLIARSHGWTRFKLAVVDLVKFAVAVLASILLACLVGLLFGTAIGIDPRGGVHDTYVQRNALVVGFIMGFAIIPIIYTIAEDALSTVPDHLRSASLATGATPWQTATRIIVPTAMSGLFSAVMIGLGRAVGETMIVLMAAGNTPVMEANIFNGFRTLSANIAVELPEAVKNSTHYRTLYLAALVLFIMTFVLNTLAESVRQRFRRRAYQL
jgi:phosphate transport system permease protein